MTLKSFKDSDGNTYECIQKISVNWKRGEVWQKNYRDRNAAAVWLPLPITRNKIINEFEEKEHHEYLLSREYEGFEELLELRVKNY